MCEVKNCPVKKLCEEVNSKVPRRLFLNICETVSETLKDFCIRVVEIVKKGRKKNLSGVELEIFIISNLLPPEKEFEKEFWLINKGLKRTFEEIIPRCENFSSMNNYYQWIQKELSAGKIN